MTNLLTKKEEEEKLNKEKDKTKYDLQNSINYNKVHFSHNVNIMVINVCIRIRDLNLKTN